jgi:putative ABC transport system ATP-binding protein
MKAVVKLLNVTYKIQDGNEMKPILNNVSHLFPAENLSVISGPSGSGKTTLLYAISGLLDHLDNGSISVNDTNIYSLKEHQKDTFRLNNISMIFQSLNLFPFLNVQENICVPVYAKNKNVTAETKKKISYYLDKMGLGQIQKKALGVLSGGEQQRVAIIRAIIDEPALILCDEPTACLDRENSVIFLENIKTLITDTKLTAIIVSHDATVEQYADHLVELSDGKIL